MIELRNISYSVNENGKEKEILKNINISFGDNKIYVITGHNGSGKTTLVKIIMGILKQSSGQIFLNGEDISNWDASKRARNGLSFAFQQPIKFKGLTVKKLMQIASGSEIKLDENCEYLSKVGLCARNYLGREFNSSLSGGELKRIELAMCLARNSSVNIFDEPEAGIDLWSFDSLISVFKELKEKTKGTIIIVSHQKKILEIADEIIVLNKSEIDMHGRGKEILLMLNNSSCKKLEDLEIDFDGEGEIK